MDNLVAIILSALASSGLTYFFGIRHLRTETEIKIKAEKYNNLIKYLRGFTRQDGDSLKDQFLQEWETSWLYCSDEVFKKVSKMLRYVRQKGKGSNANNGPDIRGTELLGDIIIAMRKDLLRKRTGLSNKDFIFWEVHKEGEGVSDPDA